MIQLRRATPDDAPALTALCERTFRDTYSAHNTIENMTAYLTKCFSVDLQRAEILDPEKRVVVAEISGALVGYYILTTGSPTTALVEASAIEQPAIELSRFYVETKLHGSRLSHTMMQHALTLARNDGFKTLWLGVWEQNLRAIAFYKKWLFKPIGEHTFTLGTDPQRDLLFARR